MTPTQTISNQIIEVMNINGFTVREAINFVLGAGTFEKLAGDLYDDLRRKEAA